MTDNVKHFPVGVDRMWYVFWTDLENELRAAGTDEAAITGACEALKPAFMAYFDAKGMECTAHSIEEALMEVSRYYSGAVFGMLLHMAKLAVENHELREALASGRGGRG